MNEDELMSLTDASNSDSSIGVEQRTVFVVRPPVTLMRLFEGIQCVIARYPNVAAVRRYSAGRRAAELAVAVQGLALPMVASAEDLQIQGINASECGLHTSTLACPPERTFVGLHCDSFGERIVPNPAIDPTRLCINIGPEKRHFLFADVLVHSALSATDHDDSASAFRTRYLSEGPPRTIYRLTLQPGEAYLAPTANLIHDATTIGKRAIDVTYGIVGHFDFDRICSSWRM